MVDAPKNLPDHAAGRLPVQDRMIAEIPLPGEVMDRFGREFYPALIARIPKTPDTARLDAAQIAESYAPLSREKLSSLVGLEVFRNAVATIQPGQVLNYDEKGVGEVHAKEGQIYLSIPVAGGGKAEVLYKQKRDEMNARDGETIGISYIEFSSTNGFRSQMLDVEFWDGYYALKAQYAGDHVQESEINAEFVDDEEGNVVRAGVTMRSTDTPFTLY